MGAKAVQEAVHQLLERANRPGLLGVVGLALEKRCRKDLQGYFASLGKKILALKLEELAHEERGITVEHAKHAVEMKLHNLLRTTTPELHATLKVNIQEAVLKADKLKPLAEAADIYPAGEDDLSDPDVWDKVGMTAQQAAAYAEQQAGGLITGIRS